MPFTMGLWSWVLKSKKSTDGVYVEKQDSAS